MPKRKVAFARVNRRADEGFERRRFADDMRQLAEAHNTRKEVAGKEWIAADMTVDVSGDFLTGMLGFNESDLRRHFEPDAWSWLKAERHTASGASEKAIVPFAVDLRDDRRWVGHATSPRIRAETYAYGFAVALNVAVGDLGLWPSDWEVDLVVEPIAVEEWIKRHPDIREFTRTVKLPNPGRDISDDLAEMRALAAKTKEETFTAQYDKTLRITDEIGRLTQEFAEKLQGLGEGQVEISLEARGRDQVYRFSSRKQTDSVFIDDYGDDWELGMQLVLDAVRAYSEERASS